MRSVHKTQQKVLYSVDLHVNETEQMHRNRLIILHILSLLLTCVSIEVKGQSDENITLLDSLHRRLSIVDNKREELQLLYEITFNHYSVDSTGYYAHKTIKLAHEIGEGKVEAASYGLLSWVEFHNNDYTQSCLYAQQGLVIADSIGDKEAIANMNYYLGNAYGMLNDFNTAISHYARALDIYTEQDKKDRQCSVLRNMANVEYVNMLFDDAKGHVNSSLGYDYQLDNKEGLAEDYFLMGEIFFHKYNFQKYTKTDRTLLNEAKVNYRKSLDYAKQVDDDYITIHASVFFSNIFVEEAKIATTKRERAALLDSCKMLIDQSYKDSRRLGYDIETKTLDNISCQWLTLNGDYARAKEKLDSVASIYLADESTYAEDIVYIYNVYSDYYNAIGEHDKALKYANMHHERRYNTRQSDFVANAARSVMVGEYNMKLREREIRFETETKQRKIVTFGISVILFMISILTISLIRGYILKNRINQKLDLKNNELEQQKEEVQAQNERLEEQRNLLAQANHKITDSINYASLIQGAAMPSEKLLTELVGEHFVIFRPKDIVSGDFYWANEHNGLKMIAVADCTGHGVPGAFVSMLGISILNELSVKTSTDNISAGSILDELRAQLIVSLHQGGKYNESRDGMDIGLLIIDEANQELHYAGAYRPLIIYHEGERRKIEADHMPIGVYATETKPFTNNKLPLCSGDMLYLFTDGIVDQFGYDDKKGKESKYTARRLYELLDNINTQTCEEQSATICKEIDDWRRVSSKLESEQTDDNLMVGIRIK